MLKLANLKLQTKTEEINGVEYVVKKFTVGVSSSLFIERYEGCEFEKDEEDKVKAIKGRVNNSVELIAREIFAGLASWGLVGDNNFALPLTEKNCLDFAVYYPIDAQEVLTKIRAFNFEDETAEQTKAKKK